MAVFQRHGLLRAASAVRRDATGPVSSGVGRSGGGSVVGAHADNGSCVQTVTPAELEVVVVDTTVQEKAVAYPTDSRLLEAARAKIALLAKRSGLELKQTYAKEGKSLRRRAGGYAHAKQFKRQRRVSKRQRTILGRLMRDVQRQMKTPSSEAQSRLAVWLERAERIRTQRPKDKNKLYALHAPEVECIGKGKARQPYEFGVKVGIAIGIDCGLIVGARSFAGNPYDGHTLGDQMEQRGSCWKRWARNCRRCMRILAIEGATKRSHR